MTHHGREVDTQGEGFFVAFGRAKDSVAATVAAQCAHAAEPWPDGSVVRVRMGIHTAEPELSSDGYFGMGVHRAARICALGHGGQILLSRSTAGLVDEDEIPGLELRDLGEHMLRGCSTGQSGVYQLVADGLDDEFPPLRSVTALAQAIEASRFPTGTVTFLVTDMVGSVAMLRTLGIEGYSSTLERYERIVRDAVAAHDGHAFEIVGDSFISVFARARDALFAAVDARDAFTGDRLGSRAGGRGSVSGSTPGRPSAGGRATSGSA